MAVNKTVRKRKTGMIKVSAKNLENEAATEKAGRRLLFPLTIIIIFAIIYYFRGQFIAATVNGSPISRFALTRNLEKQAGKKTLDSMITKTLIMQEAKKRNITVSKEQIDQAMKNLEENFQKQGQNLDQLLSLQGMTREELREQIKIQKIVEKAVGSEAAITDKDVNDYLEKNKSLLSKDTKIEEIKPVVKQQLEQQKLQEKADAWVKSLRDKAKIIYFTNF